MLLPFVRAELAGPAPYRLPECLLFPARSREYLPQRHRKRCVPNRGEWLLQLTNTQNCDALRVQSVPTRNVVIEPSVTFLPGLRLLTPQLFTKVFANQRMRIQLARTMRILSGKAKANSRYPVRGRNLCHRSCQCRVGCLIAHNMDLRTTS